MQEKHLAQVNTIHNKNTKKNMKRKLNFTEFIKPVLGNTTLNALRTVLLPSLSLLPRTHMVEGENRLIHVFL